LKKRDPTFAPHTQLDDLRSALETKMLQDMQTLARTGGNFNTLDAQVGCVKRRTWISLHNPPPAGRRAVAYCSM
jgi:hypothetical protein